jgi:hypothetical protein
VGLDIEWVIIDCPDVDKMSAFWSAALDYEHVRTGPLGGHILAARDDSKRCVAMFPVAEGKQGKNRVHLDLRPDNQDAEVARLEGVGATRIDIGQRDASWFVMADPEDNEFCVLRALPANSAFEQRPATTDIPKRGTFKPPRYKDELRQKWRTALGRVDAQLTRGYIDKEIWTDLCAEIVKLHPGEDGFFLGPAATRIAPPALASSLTSSRLQRSRSNCVRMLRRRPSSRLE